MMIDDKLEFADATAISTSATADAIFGDVYDTTANPTLKDLGNGEPLYCVVQVDTALGGATSLRLRFCSDSTADLATSKTTHWDSGVVALSGNWAVGTVYVFALPIEATYERYIGFWQNIVGTANAGKLNIFFTKDVAKWRAYDSAVE